MSKGWSGKVRRITWGLRERVTILVLAGILVAGAGSYALLMTLGRHWLVQELDSRGRGLADLLAQRATTSLLLEDATELRGEVNRAASDADVVGVSIHRLSGSIIASRINAPEEWKKATQLTGRPQAANPSVSVRRLRGLEVRTFLAPVERRAGSVTSQHAEASEVFGFAAPSEPSPRRAPERIGWVRVVLSTERLEGAVARVGRIGLAAMGLFLVLGLAAAMGLMRIAVRPLQEASALAREIAAGRLDRRLPTHGDDELGALADSMNLMASRLGEARRAAQEEASALRRATEAVVAVAQGARSIEGVSGLFPVVAEQLRRVTGCTAVALAVPRSNGGPPVFAHFEPASPWGGLRPGTSLDPATSATLAKAGGAPVRLAVDSTPDPLSWALCNDGYRAAALVPLPLEEGTSAVLLLASGEPAAFPASQIGVAAGLASHLSAALHAEQLRARLELAFEELERTRDQLIKSEKLRTAGELASAVAHEFNNLLGAILGRAELLRARAHSGDLPVEELAAGLRVMERAAQDGADTVRRLRQFATGPDTRGREAVDLDAAIRDAAEFTRVRWQNEARAEGRAIDVRIESAPGAWVSGRASELREVFTNLILNAIDAITRDGEVVVRCVAEDSRVLVSVEDDGEGMSSETRARLFEPFFSTKGERGSGLGLSVVYGIAQRHDGRISIDSTLGKGTRVELSFPRAAEKAEAPREPSPLALPSIPTLRVLIVDDEPAVLDLLTDIVDTLGHEATAFADAQSALAEFRARPYDLVLTDLGMPGMTGWEFSRALRALDPGVTLAWITGWGEELSEDAARHGDADAVVAKPFTVDDVNGLLRLAAERRATRRAA